MNPEAPALAREDYDAFVLRLESPVCDMDQIPKTAVVFMAMFVNASLALDLVKRLGFYAKKPDQAFVDRMHDDMSRRSTIVDAEPPIGSFVDPRIVHAICGIATEAGELVEELLKASVEKRPLDYDNLLEELGDLSWYRKLAMLALEKQEGQGRFTEQGVLSGNIAKLNTRYGKGQASGDNRNTDAEMRALTTAAEAK